MTEVRGARGGFDIHLVSIVPFGGTRAGLHRKITVHRQATGHDVRQEGLSVHSIRAAPFPRGLSLFSPWEAVYAVAQ